MCEFCNVASVKRLLDKIDEYYDLPAGWDAETDLKTDVVSLDRLKDFVLRLTDDNTLLPEESIGTGDEVALYWQVSDNGNSVYYIIHFYPDYFRAYCDKGGKADNFWGEYNDENIKKLLNLIPTRQEVSNGLGH